MPDSPLRVDAELSAINTRLDNFDAAFNRITNALERVAEKSEKTAILEERIIQLKYDVANLTTILAGLNTRDAAQMNEIAKLSVVKGMAAFIGGAVLTGAVELFVNFMGK